MSTWTNDQIIPQQLGSLLLAVLLVFLLTAVSQRGLLLGLVSAAPTMVTLVVLFGVMGFAQINLSVITGIMSGRLAVGFTAMIFSPLQIHVSLSVLMWVTMMMSAFLSLTLLPTITAKLRTRSA
jgi:predicted RND superfamily exporter protein